MPAENVGSGQVQPHFTYRPRVLDSELRTRLLAVGAIVIEGPKACGKTETARQVVASEVRLDVDASARAAAAVDPTLVLDGAVPRLLDEWQTVPGLWNQVRRAVDDRHAPGQFVLTGSAVPADDETRHTGSGRFARLRMRTMTLFESGDGDGTVSLAEMLAGAAPRVSGPGLDVRRIAALVARGGWPANLELALPDALRANVDYLEEVCRADMSRVDGVQRDPARVRRVIASLARNVASEANPTVIGRDAGNEDPVERRTVSSYLSALQRLMVVEDSPAWSPHLRSRARLRSGATRYFVDPSLAVAALGAGPERLLADLNFLGLLFESLAVRDLRVYAQPLGGRVMHYRDSNGLEVDAIVECPDGRWGAFEVKLGGEEHENRAAASLLSFAETVDVARCGRPAALAVITATGGYSYVRPDGVAVVPLAFLGP